MLTVSRARSVMKRRPWFYPRLLNCPIWTDNPNSSPMTRTKTVWTFFSFPNFSHFQRESKSIQIDPNFFSPAPTRRKVAAALSAEDLSSITQEMGTEICEKIAALEKAQLRWWLHGSLVGWFVGWGSGIQLKVGEIVDFCGAFGKFQLSMVAWQLFCTV